MKNCMFFLLLFLCYITTSDAKSQEIKIFCYMGDDSIHKQLVGIKRYDNAGNLVYEHYYKTEEWGCVRESALIPVYEQTFYSYKDNILQYKIGITGADTSIYHYYYNENMKIIKEINFFEYKESDIIHKATQTNYLYNDSNSYYTEDYGVVSANVKGNIVTNRYYRRNRFNEFVQDSIVINFEKFIDPFTPDASTTKYFFKYNYSDTGYTYYTYERESDELNSSCNKLFVFNTNNMLTRHNVSNCDDDNYDVYYEYDTNDKIKKLKCSCRTRYNKAKGFRELRDMTFLFKYD